MSILSLPVVPGKDAGLPQPVTSHKSGGRDLWSPPLESAPEDPLQATWEALQEAHMDLVQDEQDLPNEAALARRVAARLMAYFKEKEGRLAARELAMKKNDELEKKEEEIVRR